MQNAPCSQQCRKMKILLTTEGRKLIYDKIFVENDSIFKSLKDFKFQYHDIEIFDKLYQQGYKIN